MLQAQKMVLFHVEMPCPLGSRPPINKPNIVVEIHNIDLTCVILAPRAFEFAREFVQSSQDQSTIIALL